ncbi:TA system VapC family ribonuclease toxin [Candidatus Spongiisocius sp.]|uniref:TA system VapC family ribonuclease toxin n=1 Tax=Candidatus Spongiisocius sp. TaxID=3101273 RepID=UPI003B5CD998
MLLDANLLLYATDRSSPHHERSAVWLTSVLRGDRRVGIPWQSLGAFLRIGTSPRVYENPMSAERAWGCVRAWLDAEPTWIPPATERTTAILGSLVTGHHVTANLIPDAMLAALAVEHGLTVMSADTDFARFGEVRWENPLAGGQWTVH